MARSGNHPDTGGESGAKLSGPLRWLQRGGLDVDPLPCLGSRQAARAAGRPGGRPAARPNTRGCPPLCLGSRQPARVAGLGGRSTRLSNSLS